jgi:DHA2 family multidrug resistance protein
MSWASGLALRRVRSSGGAAIAPPPAGAAPARSAPPPSPPPAHSSPGIEDQPTWRDWAGVLAMVTGLFLAIMDVQIVSSSLTQIQGGLSASSDEIAWIQSAYLIADVVMVPFSGTLSRLFSTRITFVVATLGFTGASVLCATATSLGQMILYRAMQGFCAGAITPSVFPVVYTRFRGAKLPTMLALISIILNLSSTLGPTVGGFLTDTFSWHWLFLVNVVPGLLGAAVVWVTIDIDKPDFSLLRDFDVIGLVLMATFLGCLEYALEEGPRWDWLDDSTIRNTVIISAIASVFFFWRVLTYRQPIVDLRAYTNRNFALGCFYTFVIGVGMYGTTYLLPLFLAQVRGYSSLQIGTTVVVSGLFMMALSPFSAQIARRLDLRLMLGIGLALFAVSMYLMARSLTNETGFWELFVPQALRGIALMFCYLPANMLALGTVAPEKLKNAAGLYNLTRDLGGALGLATIGTVMNERVHFHWNRLVEDINPARPVVQHFLETQTARFESLISGDPAQAALQLLAGRVQREALVLSYHDALLMIGAVFAIGVMLMPLARRGRTLFSR